MGEQVQIKITAQDQTKQGIKSAEDNLTELERRTDAAADKLQGKAVAAFAALTVAIGGTAKMSMDFEATMDRVAAISGATGDEFKQLEQTALEMGAKTVFSATQSADALTYLAQAGFKTQEQIAAIPGIMNMAAAGVVDLASAADIGSSILAGFNLQADQMGRVADILTAGFNATNADLSDLGEAMKFVAPLASSLGLSIEEVTASVGLLSNAGIKGGNAGRQLRGALSDLLKPSEEAAQLMNRLGITTVDESGKFRNLADMVGQVERATADMTEAQRAQTVATLMGSEGAAAFLALMQSGPDKIRALTTELENSGGTAERVATQQLDNLKGSLEQMKGQFEDAAIAIGDDFNPQAAAAIQWITDLLAAVAGIARESPEAVRQIGTLAVTVSAATVAVTAAVKAYTALKVAMGPEGWLLLGVGALIGLLADLAINWKAASMEQEKQAQNLLNLSDQYQKATRAMDDAGKSEADRAKASEDQKKAIKEIGDAFPELVKRWDEHGKAVELDTQRLNENTEATLRNKKAKDTTDLNDLQNEANAIQKEINRLEGLKKAAQAPSNMRRLTDDPNYIAGLEAEIAKQKQAFDRAVARVTQKQIEMYGPAQGDWENQPINWTTPSAKPNGGGGGSGTGTGSSDPYKAALRNIEHLRSVEKISASEEIAMLEDVQATIAKGADDRMDIEERIFRAKKALSEQQKQDAEKDRKEKLDAALRNLDFLNRVGLLEKDQEAKRLKEMLDNYSLTTEERLSLIERYKAATDAANQAVAKSDEDRIRKDLAAINHWKQMGDLTREQEITAIQAHLNREAAYYAKHTDELWALDERLYQLREQGRQDQERKTKESLQKAEKALSESLAAAEKDVLETIKARQDAAERSLQNEIDLAEERLKLYDQQISAEDRLRKIQDARAEVDRLRREGEQEQVLLADGTKVMRTRGLAEAERALDDARRDDQRARDRIALQDQIDNLRTRLSNLRESNAAELEAQKAHWESIKAVAEDGFKDLDGLTGAEFATRLESLKAQLATELGIWTQHAQNVARIMSGIQTATGTAGSPPTPPAGTPPAIPAVGAAMGAALAALPTFPGGLLGGVVSQAVSAAISVQVNVPPGTPAQTVQAAHDAARAGTAEALIRQGISQGRIAGPRPI